jgi:hypothetical protein
MAKPIDAGEVGDSRHIEDVAWWIKERKLDLKEIRAAVGTLPNLTQREIAAENMVLVGLVTPSERARE